MRFIKADGVEIWGIVIGIITRKMKMIFHKTLPFNESILI